MIQERANSWIEENQRLLGAELEFIRDALQRLAARSEKTDSVPTDPAAAMADPPGTAIEAICRAFSLSPFERKVLLLCAGMELDSSFASRCARASGDPRLCFPTFAVALAAFADAHWSALTPGAPLRRWRLIECSGGESLTVGGLRIDERILHALTGISYLDDRLQGLVAPLEPPSGLVASQLRTAEQIARLAEGGGLRLIQLSGADQEGKRNVASSSAARAGLRLYVLRAGDIPASAGERDVLARLWQREILLDRVALLIDGVGRDQTAPTVALVDRLSSGLVFVAGDEPIAAQHHAPVRFEVEKPSAREQEQLWRAAFAGKLNGAASRLVAQFNLDERQIEVAAGQAKASGAGDDEETLAAQAWEACRLHTRGRLEGLAEHVECAASWDDLVLPAPLLQTLREIEAYARSRARVYEDWGFAAKGRRGLGISALFAGASGTGKTMAAEVLARELALDLFRIDLSQIVSKFIGETEKNLRRVFDAAEDSGAVLLFDEADALFGKRSEVRDSHDRYANVEVSYLLQRMETYRGLAILTTNMKSQLDTAFLRRLRFIVQFPTPDSAQRAEIWRRVFPAQTPIADLDVAKLARLNVTGGHIRNIAMHAAFLAADGGDAVRMPHLLRAVRHEYAKLERPLNEGELRDWV